MRALIKIFSLVGFVWFQSFAVAAKESHGIALGALPAYDKNLNFPWVSLSAPKGGTFVLGMNGTFDSMNPFAVKNAANGLLWDIGGNGLVFESLTLRSLGEPFTVYGFLAESIDLASDGKSITFRLNPLAKWSDGKDVTADDVLFSFKVLTGAKASPMFKTYYQDVGAPKAVDRRTIVFPFKQVNRELPLIVGELPILPRHVYGATGKDFVKSFVKVAPVGSGPYVVKSFEFGKYIDFERRKDYWASTLPLARGSWNFDQIKVKYYKDENAVMEGFKAGDFDIRIENSSRAWQVDHAGPKWDRKWIRKEIWEHHQNQGAQGFVFNLRRPLFQDRLVRKALAIAFDFEWANDTLFYKQYKVSDSFFNNSEFNAQELPSAAELEILNPLKSKLPSEVFSEKKTSLLKGVSGKRRLAEALKLLNEAGWTLKDNVLKNAKGESFEFTFLLDSPVMARVVEPYLGQLEKIGIKGKVRTEDLANYLKRVERWDFDMISIPFGQSESPGNEQRDYWHSVSADKSETRNYMGLKNPAIDQLVDRVIAAKSREDLVVATRALDRALWFEHIMVPNWYMAGYRVSWWNKFGVPQVRPDHFQPLDYFLRFGWFDEQLQKKLSDGMKNNTSL